MSFPGRDIDRNQILSVEKIEKRIIVFYFLVSSKYIFSNDTLPASRTKHLHKITLRIKRLSILDNTVIEKCVLLDLNLGIFFLNISINWDRQFVIYCNIFGLAWKNWTPQNQIHCNTEYEIIHWKRNSCGFIMSQILHNPIILISKAKLIKKMLHLDFLVCGFLR